MSRALVLFTLAMLGLSACSSGSMGPGQGSFGGGTVQDRTDLATQTACRQRVAEMSNYRYRDKIYVPQTTMNTPFSTDYQPGVSSRGLAGEFDYDQSLLACEHNSTANSGGTGTPAIDKDR